MRLKILVSICVVLFYIYGSLTAGSRRRSNGRRRSKTHSLSRRITSTSSSSSSSTLLSTPLSASSSSSSPLLSHYLSLSSLSSLISLSLSSSSLVLSYYSSISSSSPLLSHYSSLSSLSSLISLSSSSSSSSSFSSSLSSSSSSSSVPGSESQSSNQDIAISPSSSQNPSANPSPSPSPSAALTTNSYSSNTLSSNEPTDTSARSKLTPISTTPHSVTEPLNLIPSLTSSATASSNKNIISQSNADNVATTATVPNTGRLPTTSVPNTGRLPITSATVSSTGAATGSALYDPLNTATTSLFFSTGMQAIAASTTRLVYKSSSGSPLASSSVPPTSNRVDGGFSEWSAWSSCTKTCNTGNMTRTRACTIPATANNGSTCNGSYTDTETCNTRPCPIDGDWSEWTSWSYCNKPCGSGSSERTRSCTNPVPMYGGLPCNGLDSEENQCNSHPCAAVMMQYVVRFTSEEFNTKLQDIDSTEWNDMKKKIILNAKINSTIDSNIVHIEVISHRRGSVISTFNVSYSAIDSIQVVQLLESNIVNGVFGNLPAQIITITPDIVPISTTITYASNSSSTSILLKWLQVSGVNVVGYAAYYKEKDTTFLPVNVKTTPAANQKMVVSGLKKFTNYSLAIVAFTSEGNGLPSTFVNASTDEDVPSKPPGNFQVVPQSSTSLLLTWEAIVKEFLHGIILGYNVTYIKHGFDNERIVKYKIMEPDVHTFTLEDLGKFTTFTISACGFTSKGCGVSTSIIIAQTTEDVPSMPPQNFQATNFTSEKSITLYWTPVPREHINGVLVGYVIRYQLKSLADVNVETADTNTRIIPPGNGNTVFHGIQQYSVWKFKIYAVTNAGEGVSSTFAYGASCRCPKTLYTNFFVHPPYLSTKDDGSFNGVFYNVTGKMIKWACGNCINGHGETEVNMKSNGKGGDAYKKGSMDVVNDIDDVPHASFPIFGNDYMNKYMAMYEYIHLMDSPGIAFITISDPAGKAGEKIINSVLGCIPLLMIALLMALLAGFVVWFLEFRSNPEQFSPSFFSGVGDGFWWAYVSMTTVGYGDRFTVSNAGRVFSIIWTLTGLVIISMLTGSIATALTTETVLQDIMLYGAKVAAIQNSTEHRIGILKNAKVNLDKKYNNLEELKQALKNRNVQGILLDLLVAAENQKQIFDSEIKVNKLLKKKFGYGIVLSGSAAVVSERCRDYIKKNIADITKLIEMNTKTLEPNEDTDKEEEVPMFDSQSTLFQRFLMFCCAFLVCACIAGLVWHFGCHLKKGQAINLFAKEKEKRIIKYKDELIREMNEMVQQFHQVQMKTLETMKENLTQELLLFLKEKKDRKSKNVFLRIASKKRLTLLAQIPKARK